MTLTGGTQDNKEIAKREPATMSVETVRQSVDADLVEARPANDHKTEVVLSEPLQRAIMRVPILQPVGKIDFYKNGAVYEPFGDYTDAGQAKVFVQVFGNQVRYVQGLGYIAFDGIAWRDSYQIALGLSYEITERQKREAEIYLSATYSELADAEKQQDNQSAKDIAQSHINRAKRYMVFVWGRRNSGRLKATLAVAQPFIELPVDKLDAKPYVLNTPGGTIDLSSGEIYAHNPEDFCTKVTGACLSDHGRDEFYAFIDQITCQDTELARFLQELAGLCAIGRADEHLWIPYGLGGNGKTTFFELIRLVLGEYAGGYDTGLLVQKKNFNALFEKMSLFGKRFVLASELGQSDSEIKKLDTELMKQIITTGLIHAAKKGEDAIDFLPTHTTVMMLNQLPMVVATDVGTWSRIRVIPFNASFRDRAGEIKDYQHKLYNDCSGAVLSWIVEGASRVIANGGDIKLCNSVIQATDAYRSKSDSVFAFYSDMLIRDESGIITANDMNNAYESYCQSTGRNKKPIQILKDGLNSAGYAFKHTNKGNIYQGARLR